MLLYFHPSGIVIRSKPSASVKMRSILYRVEGSVFTGVRVHASYPVLLYCGTVSAIFNCRLIFSLDDLILMTFLPERHFSLNGIS
jgi:hypothetical protein